MSVVYNFSVPEDKIVECDIDGVIANIHDTVACQLRSDYATDEVYKNFTFDKFVHQYDMKDLRPDVRKRAFELFSTPELIRTLPVYDGAKEFLQWVNMLAVKNGLQLFLHTQSFTEQVAMARTAWLQDLVKELNLCNVVLGVDCGDKSMGLRSRYIIEDCYGNIEASRAWVRLLINKSYNQLPLDGTWFKRVCSYSDIQNIMSEHEAIMRANSARRSLILS